MNESTSIKRKTRLRSTVVGFTIAVLVVAAAGTASANPCETNRSFAEANGCNEVFDAARVDTGIPGLALNGRVR